MRTHKEFNVVLIWQDIHRLRQAFARISASAMKKDVYQVN